MSVLSGTSDRLSVMGDKLSESQLFECYHCWYKTKNKVSLEDHMRTHLVEKPYACNLCDFKASQKNYLWQHQKAHAVFGCSICDYKSYNKTHVEDHLAKAHRTPLAKKLLRCRACDYETHDEAFLKRHVAARHVEGNHKCNVCDYETPQKRLLQTHMVTNHPGVKPFSCDECDYKASCSKNLQKHKKIHSPEKPFSCDSCTFTAASKHSLEAHKKIHGDKPYACTICEYRSYNKSNVSDHMKIHTGDKPLTCTFCPYSTRKRSDLKRHMKVHSTKKKPYKCKVCNHRTNQKYTLEYHMKTHTGERPFACNMCAKQFFRRSGLCDHMVKSHAVKDGESIRCKLCDYTAKKGSEVTKHILSNHTRLEYTVVTTVESEDAFVVEERVQLFSPAAGTEHELITQGMSGTETTQAASGITDIALHMPETTEITHFMDSPGTSHTESSATDISNAIPDTLHSTVLGATDRIVFVATETTDGTIVVTAEPAVLPTFFTAETIDNQFDATNV